MEKWAKTLNSNEPKKQLEFYEGSNEVQVISSSGKISVGFTEITAEYEAAKKQIRFFDSKLTNITSRELGDTAVVKFRHGFVMEIAEDKSKWQRTVRTTMVLLKTSGAWKIVSEHSSPILGVEFTKQLETDRANESTKRDAG